MPMLSNTCKDHRMSELDFIKAGILLGIVTSLTTWFILSTIELLRNNH